jgi:hypothetical protein
LIQAKDVTVEIRYGDYQFKAPLSTEMIAFLKEDFEIDAKVSSF